jgi:hypothetical protein
MENTTSQELKNFTDVRYNKVYGIVITVLSVALLIFTLLSEQNDIFYYVLIGVDLILIAFGLNSLIGKRYFRHDKQNKMVIIYAGFGSISQRYKYDRLYLKNRRLYREIDGKEKFINIIIMQCNRADLEAFTKEIQN